MEEHRATVEVDAPPSGKRLQGAWLRLDTGKRLLADYRPKFYTAFDGLKVQVKGECWEPDPQAQAIMAQHFRVQELDVAEGNEDSPEFVGLRGVITLKGRLEVMRGEAGSKSEDESRLVFREIREVSLEYAHTCPRMITLNRRDVFLNTSTRCCVPSRCDGTASAALPQVVSHRSLVRLGCLLCHRAKRASCGVSRTPPTCTRSQARMSRCRRARF
mmetsp:Transcript_18399/g.45174  ORF Transcript_18399/g.45174 Transcript_18399/m.45174 type:complete len:216 (+) Transcript_18399:213-860(+)